MKTGIELIAEERTRQIEKEAWTPEHDDTHQTNELSMAAVAYVLWCANPFLQEKAKEFWPWDEAWFKPKDFDEIRNLVKAGALIAAEIDRLQREQAS